MSTSFAETWQRVVGCSPQGIVVIIDPQVGNSFGQLRALPLLRELGLEIFTFASGWRGLPMVDYKYKVIHAGTAPNNIVDALPICQFVSQEIELASESEATKKLLMAYQQRSDEPLLVYVIDSEKFILRTSVGSKSFVDEYEIQHVIAYPRLFARYSAELGYPVPAVGAGVSLNLALHRLAWERDRDEHVRRLGDLFDVSLLSPESRLWDWLEYLVVLPGVEDSDQPLVAALRSWIDTDITRVSRRLMELLQRFNFTLDKIRAERERLRTLTIPPAEVASP